MRQRTTMVAALILPFLVLGSSVVFAQTPVDDWGAVGTRLAATGWMLDIDATTPAGDAYLSGDVMSSNWTAIRGGFDEVMVATLEEAVVVRGEMEIVGGSVGEWNPFRWGLFRHNDIGELQNPNSPDAIWGYTVNPDTDSASFVSNEAQAHGYLVTNQTGSEGAVGGNGGAGSLHAVNGGSWISTFSGGTAPLGSPFEHAPRRADMPEGRYEFAISAIALEDGTTEVSWYMVSVDGVGYWHAGTHIDTTAQKTEFNGIAFSFRPEVEGITAINLYNVTVENGDPIEIPDAPFSSFYVDAWGAIGTRLAATGWTLDNDESTLVGDAYLSGDVMSSNWTAIRGGFGGAVHATLEEALIVRGEFEIIGADVGEWNPFRWGLFHHDDVGQLQDPFTPEAIWGYTVNPDTDSAAFVSNEAQAHGYLVTNQTGSEGPVGGNGGSGSVHAVNGGSWISTFSGGTAPLGSPYDQAPRGASMPQGTYEFAMSVQPLEDGTTEVRWFIMHEDEESYWHAGTHIDTTAQKTAFNGFLFSFRPEVVGVTGINLYEVQIDRGAAIEIPDAPFSAFYVDEWGAIGTRLEATGWTLDNDQNTLVGDAFLSGEGTSSNWTAIRGGFGGSLFATESEALIVRGELEIIGADVGEWNPFRWGLFRHDDAGELQNQYTPEAIWGYTVNPDTDSAAFVSNEAQAHGYLVTNQTGSEGPVGGNGGSGSVHAVNGGSWISTFSGGTAPLGSPFGQAPRQASMPEGTYEFAMSVQPLSDGTTEVRWYMMHEDEESYWHAGIHTDTTAQKSEFNGFLFSFRPEVEGVTGINLYEVQIDRGAPIEIPDAPFSAFYVDAWGFLGERFGAGQGEPGWSLIPGDLVGDVTISGDALTGWAALAGSFGSTVTPTDEALVISGDLILEGGGFEDVHSLRIGLFNQNLGTQDSTETAGYVWTGEETATGYLFIPGNGVADPPDWSTGGSASAGSVSGGAWFDPMGDGAEAGVVGVTEGSPTAGTYELEMSVHQLDEGGNDVRLKLTKDDGTYSYVARVVDNGEGAVTTSFNSIVFAINNSATTELAIEALQVEMGEPIATSIEQDITDSNLPSSFALAQNYPNPFNPSTTIKFDVPDVADVKLDVFNMLGQHVMTLVNGRMQPGSYEVMFDARSFASGMYVYRFEAADFVQTRKMILVK